MKFDVVVIGAGVVGALVARELSRYELKVALLERSDDVAAGASRANSGIVHGGFDPMPGTRKAELNLRGTMMMPALTAELGVSYRNNGSLVLAFSEEEAAHVRALYDRGIANGVPGLSILSREEVFALEPNVSREVVAALRCTSSGIVCPYGLTIAAVGNAMDNGVKLICNFEVDHICHTADGYVIYAGDRKVESDYIVNCAGLFADRVAAMVGDTGYNLIPRMGEYMLLDHAARDLCSHTLFQVPTAAGKGILVSPTADGNILIGPTSVEVENRDRDHRDTSAAGLAVIRRAAEKSVPQIPWRQIITSFTGLRASLEGGDDFVIEASKAAARVVHAVGIDSPGLSSAPAIAKELVALLQGEGLVCKNKENFCGTRPSYHAFAHLSDEEKNAKIAENPAYGHVICRCEVITEGEIVDAIHRNPPARSMDAVKRRVRTGMGRCQGGFCTTYITEILARELGISVGEVTKFGEGSELLRGFTKEEEEWL